MCMEVSRTLYCAFMARQCFKKLCECQANLHNTIIIDIYMYMYRDNLPHMYMHSVCV